jgi:hypothetical protein
MPETVFSFQAVNMTVMGITLCTFVSLFLGIMASSVYSIFHSSNKNFVTALALLPVIVQSIIMLVNGNVGTGIAVMGAFSLVRFRSVPGTAQEIVIIFLTMAIGLATGTGHVIYAFVFTVVISGMVVLFSVTRFGEEKKAIRSLKIVIPEDLDYSELFDDIFAKYTIKANLERVRTVNLGSLYELWYTVVLKDKNREKYLLDEIRQRNSNLDISCGRIMANREEL